VALTPLALSLSAFHQDLYLQTEDLDEQQDYIFLSSCRAAFMKENVQMCTEEIKTTQMAPYLRKFPSRRLQHASNTSNSKVQAKGSFDDSTKSLEKTYQSWSAHAFSARYPSSSNVYPNILSMDEFLSLRILGSGAFSHVVQVRHIPTGNIFALKVLNKMKLSKDSIKNASIEQSILKEVIHPYVAGLLFAFQSPRRLYLGMEYLPGGDLNTFRKKHGRLPETLVQTYAAQLILAVSHLHASGIVHRDIKPHNCMIADDGHVRLVDFGLSKIGIYEWDTTTTIVGSPKYAAPEIIEDVFRKNQDSQGYSKQVDWWSLGVTLYEMLVGLNPFQGNTANRSQVYEAILYKVIEYPPHLSPAATALLDGMLQRNPMLRLGIESGTKTGADRINPSKFLPPPVFPEDGVAVKLGFAGGATGSTAEDLKDFTYYDNATRTTIQVASPPNDFRQHLFFHETDWVSLVKREVKADYLPPQIDNANDVEMSSGKMDMVQGTPTSGHGGMYKDKNGDSFTTKVPGWTYDEGFYDNYMRENEADELSFVEKSGSNLNDTDEFDSESPSEHKTRCHSLALERKNVDMWTVDEIIHTIMTCFDLHEPYNRGRQSKSVDDTDFTLQTMSSDYEANILNRKVHTVSIAVCAFSSREDFCEKLLENRVLMAHVVKLFLKCNAVLEDYGNDDTCYMAGPTDIDNMIPSEEHTGNNHWAVAILQQLSWTFFNVCRHPTSKRCSFLIPSISKVVQNVLDLSAVVPLLGSLARMAVFDEENTFTKDNAGLSVCANLFSRSLGLYQKAGRTSNSLVEIWRAFQEQSFVLLKNNLGKVSIAELGTHHMGTSLGNKLFHFESPELVLALTRLFRAMCGRVQFYNSNDDGDTYEMILTNRGESEKSVLGKREESMHDTMLSVCDAMCAFLVDQMCPQVQHAKAKGEERVASCSEEKVWLSEGRSGIGRGAVDRLQDLVESVESGVDGIRPKYIDVWSKSHDKRAKLPPIFAAKKKNQRSTSTKAPHLQRMVVGSPSLKSSLDDVVEDGVTDKEIHQYDSHVLVKAIQNILCCLTALSSMTHFYKRLLDHGIMYILVFMLKTVTQAPDNGAVVKSERLATKHLVLSTIRSFMFPSDEVL
jgi:hypothetical protein